MATNEATITVRLSGDERAALDELAGQAGLSRAVVLRAGLRAVLADPGLIVTRGAAAAEREAAPPPRRPRNGRRRK